jgi:hypoxanthine phosphoribosyltransferase
MKAWARCPANRRPANAAARRGDFPVATFADNFYYPGFRIMESPEQRKVPELKVLFSREQIAARVGELGAQITRDFAGEPVVLVGVLKGAAIFLSDLSRQIALDSTFDFISVSSYGNQKQNSGEVKLLKDVDQSMEGKNVILVEDILDTGLTLTYLKKMILAHHPRAFRIAALLDKKCRRQQPIDADYVGFEIPDEFVVGYGMDYAERYRNLPDICVVG